MAELSDDYAADLNAIVSAAPARLAIQCATSLPVAGSTVQVMLRGGCGGSPRLDFPTAACVLIACTVGNPVIPIPFRIGPEKVWRLYLSRGQVNRV